jgi:hypothetical protein
VGDGSDADEAAALADPGALSAAAPVLDPSRFARFTGDVDDQSVLYLASDYSSRWTLTVDGDEQPHRRAFDWANGYGVERTGSAVLAYETPLTRYGLLALQILLWLVVVVLVIRARAEPEEDAP